LDREFRAQLEVADAARQKRLEHQAAAEREELKDKKKERDTLGCDRSGRGK
jgi:hypothetical protein